MNKTLTLAVSALCLTLIASNSFAFDKKVTVSAIVGTTAFGADASWRFHENQAVTSRYTDGLDLDTDFDVNGVNYNAEFETCRCFNAS
ncbi:hypothetical protein [Vreelandella boliviensis]|uniref:Uncharacterized protein n=1 Tax=Vreelandella boliviensis LC1 TaxID=1072583 RepID=A0A265DWH4_9GAMM|nr:hypothetical protein [Halomonas boliviensis]EHJ93066.1 hypothetical protein KUC_0010 [Halomonas boliviensis LC1]OZT73681.1 hypothetical protein CE457_11840 [Halomonas boliviensis LC1]